MSKIKRKGCFEYDIEWHQNGSCLVVPKVTEQVLVNDAPIMSSIMAHTDRMDFMLRVKVPRSSKLLLNIDGVETPIQNTTRYYVSEGGGQLFKLMPPLKGKTEWRRFAIEKGWSVCVCNDVRDAVLPINYRYYANRVESLTIGMT